MRNDDPIKAILREAQPYWDRPAMCPNVRKAFASALRCQTAALGAEVYASETQKLILYHTCKSPACSSCGQRANSAWINRLSASLPNTRYIGITFTMPSELWPLFRDNPILARALPALAGEVIKGRARARYRCRVGIIAIPQTFNGQLKFNPHVHSVVTAEGLHESSGRWGGSIFFDRDLIWRSWRKAVMAILRAAVQAGRLLTELTCAQIESLLLEQESKWWNIKIDSRVSKWHFLKYAGRYVRRPPIARCRIIAIRNGIVYFWSEDKRLNRKVDEECLLNEFIDRLIQHIPKRYQHSVRSFGLFAPRAIQKTSAAVFALLGQVRQPRPKAVPWAESIKRDFGRDPLLDNAGNGMTWQRQLKPSESPGIGLG